MPKIERIPRPALRLIIYACAILAVAACLQISLPLPRPDLRIDTPAIGAQGTELDLPGSAPGDRPTDSPASVRFNFDAPHAEIPLAAGRLAALVEFTAPGMIVTLNGHFLQKVQGPRTVAAATSAFMLVQLPQALIQTGPNRLDFHFETHTGRARTEIWRAYVGPYEELQASHSRIAFLTQALPAFNFAWRLLIGLMLLGLFIARRQEVANLLLALTLITGAPPLLRSTGAAFLVPDVVAGHLGLGTLWQTAFLAMLGHYTYVRRVTASAYLLLVMAALVSGLLISGLLTPLASKVGPAYGLFCVMLGAALSALAAWQRRKIQDDVTFCSIAGLAIVALSEAQILLSAGSPGSLFRIHTTALIVLLVLSAALLVRLVLSLNAGDAFNVQLASELSLARNDLRNALEREHATLQAAALQEERERLMRDLHDGVSGRIVAIMAMCELKGGEYRQLGDMLRDVLQDLRLVITSLEDVGGDLQQVFLTFRDQTDLQLRRLGIRLHCRVPELPQIVGWMPSQSLHVYRILQECVCNASKHSGCHDIDFVVSMVETETGPLVRTLISDAGRGGAKPREGSFGLQNMRKRAVELGGKLDILSGPTGTTVRLDIPVTLAGRLAPGDQARLDAVA